MERPVALPGFFNSTQCVTVIDCRTDRGSPNLPERAQAERLYDESRPRIQLAFCDNVYRLAASGRPRVWILRAENDQYRHTLVQKLSNQFVAPRSS